MKTPPKRFITNTLTALASLALPVLAGAAQINMVGNDGLGQSSFNSGVNWAGGLAPSAGNDYFTAGFFIRTPGDSTTSDVFAGNSLTLGTNVIGSGGANGSMLEKFSLGAGSVRTLVINNFTNLAGAMVRSGGTAAAIVHISGNHYTIAGNSIIQADQAIFTIDAPLLGADNVILTNNANNSTDHVSYTGTNSGFTGSWYLEAQGTTAYSVSLDGLYSLPGNPSTFNPGQITFLANGQLRDTVGCWFTNSNGGITLAANGNINASGSTVIGEPITDVTNGVPSVSGLTASGTGTLVLSNANNTYSGTTTISAGVLQMGVNNAITNNGNVTDNSQLDLNGHNLTLNILTGSGTVDSTSGGSPTLTVGSAGGSGTLSGAIQNSSGTLSLNKTGAGTLTLSGGYTYSGQTLVSGGTLSVVTVAAPSAPGDLIVSNGAVLTADASGGTPLAANALVVGTNSTVTLALNSSANGANVNSLTLQDNATNSFGYGTVSANPTFPAINVSGSVSAPGSNIVITIAATGLRTGTFTLIKYTGSPLANLANFQVSPPPGVNATLVNNTGNHSIDISITSIPNQLAWNGVNGTAWDLSTPNWTNLISGGITVFRQYTNNGIVAGDGVTFDDTLTNDFINPQPTNINLTAKFYAFPVSVNSTLPYTIAGPGGIAGIASLTLSNSGSLTLLTSNSFTGGVIVANGGLTITNDAALGAGSGSVVLNNTTLQINGGVTNSRAISIPVMSTIAVGPNATARLGGAIDGAAASVNTSGNGTLILAARETFTGDLFVHGGVTIIDSGGSITNGSYHDVGQLSTDAATLTLRGTGSLSTTSDFNAGDLDSSSGILNVADSATLTANAIYIGSANAAGSTASGIVNQSGGTVTEISTAVGTFCIGGRTSVSALGVYNMNGGTLTANAGIRVGSTGVGTLNQNGGTINAKGGINIARIAGSFGTNNLNGGTLSTLNVASSTGTNAVFNFNGGTLQANFSPQTTTWFSGGIQANILAGGAFIDSSNNNVTISVPLLAGSPNGGLTKKGSGTLNLTGVNTFTGPITNNAGTLVLNSASTYAGAAVVNAGTLQLTTASTLQGGATTANGAVLSINQVGSATATLGNLTFNGSTNAPGATLALAPTLANNPAVPMVNCSTLTLNGTNSISLPLETVGTIALVKYTGLSGSGNCTNLALPQGAVGFISNSVAGSTLYAVITSTGPGIVWTGTNSAAGKTNLWDISTTVNWLLGSTPTTYHQTVIPGDAVTFNDSGSGTVILSNNVGPTSLMISNNTKAYAFTGPGSIVGPTGIQKFGTGTAILSVNDSYSGNTVISNGTLQLGNAAAIPSASVLVIGSGGTLETSGINLTAAELTGSGTVDNNGVDAILTIGTSSGGTWNGSIQDHGHGGLALLKNGSGTWVVGGTNNLDNASPFTTTNEFNAGATIITNGGSIVAPRLQTAIAYGGGTVATIIVAGGTLAVSNDVLSVGYAGNGSLVVNGGTVVHSGGTSGAFGGANQLIVGNVGGTGLLTVNGGQVLNSQALWLGQGTGASGTLQLNGGLVQASQITANTTPTTSAAYFNGGILQANTNSADFIDTSTSASIQHGGLVLDDGGFAINLPNSLPEDPSSTGGGLVKQGAGTVYLDAGNTYNGTTLVNSGTLAGAGSVNGPVVIAPAGDLGAGDAGGISTFTINNNLTLQGNATLRIDKTGGTPARDQVIVTGTINYGGILTITNITSDANVPTTSDTFLLFSVSGTKTGNFSGIAGSPGTGLAYHFTPSSGVLSIVTQTYVDYPTNITFGVSGNTLTLSWPADHIGWILQAQTNSLGAGLSPLAGNWTDISSSTSGGTSVITIDPTKPTVYYRLRHP